jgi:diadenosine hexaphosphate hydrolase (ATP-forming)
MKTVVQAGAVVFKNLADPKILIVRAKQDPSQWIFPKGHVEPGESLPETAVREAREEAGVISEIVSALSPVVRFEKNNREICVRYFLAELRSEIPAQENREKQWASPDELETYSFRPSGVRATDVGQLRNGCFTNGQ